MEATQKCARNYSTQYVHPKNGMCFEYQLGHHAGHLKNDIEFPNRGQPKVVTKINRNISVQNKE